MGTISQPNMTTGGGGGGGVLLALWLFSPSNSYDESIFCRMPPFPFVLLFCISHEFHGLRWCTCCATYLSRLSWPWSRHSSLTRMDNQEVGAGFKTCIPQKLTRSARWTNSHYSMALYSSFSGEGKGKKCSRHYK